MPIFAILRLPFGIEVVDSGFIKTMFPARLNVPPSERGDMILNNITRLCRFSSTFPGMRRNNARICGFFAFFSPFFKLFA
jgi:hypothetical protein